MNKKQPIKKQSKEFNELPVILVILGALIILVILTILAFIWSIFAGVIIVGIYLILLGFMLVEG